MAAPKLTPAQRNELVVRYAAGEGAAALAREYGVDASTPCRLAYTRGVSKNIGRHGKLTNDQKAEITRRYAAGEGSTTLAREFGVKDGAITAVARVRGVPIRSVSEGTRRSTINHNCFSEISPEGAYWIGFLMGDGSIRANRPTVSLKLKAQDGKHVTRFCQFVGSDLTPAYSAPRPNARVGDRAITGTGAYSVEITSRQIVADLAIHGVTARKSLTAFTPTLWENRHYWRGLIDADGSITNPRGYARLDLCGSSATIDQWISYCRKITPAARGVAYSQGKIKNAVLSGTHARQMIRHLYQAGDISLARKSEMAAVILAA